MSGVTTSSVSLAWSLRNWVILDYQEANGLTIRPWATFLSFSFNNFLILYKILNPLLAESQIIFFLFFESLWRNMRIIWKNIRTRTECWMLSLNCWSTNYVRNKCQNKLKEKEKLPLQTFSGSSQNNFRTTFTSFHSNYLCFNLLPTIFCWTGRGIWRSRFGFTPVQTRSSSILTARNW